MAIRPIDLPQAAGVTYGKGDVRHFSPGDATDVPSLQNPTRQLAERDNLLAAKVNELVEDVNNKEQFVPLPIPRTILPPLDETIVANYRIPTGYESRVLNAVVASTPASTDIELNIYYNAFYGGVSGTAVVSTATEYSGGVSFYQAGEFIIALKNKTGQTLEIAASVLLSLRPVGAAGSLLVASVVQGEKGDPGMTGPRGPAGPAGTGGAGSPGMVWSGAWNSATPYVAKQVVRYDVYGSLPSSFICVQANTNKSPQDSYLGSESYWDVVALGGVGVGSEGPVGPAGGQPNIGVSLLDGTFITGADYFASTTADGLYAGGGLPSTQYVLTDTLNEFHVGAATGSVAWVFGNYLRYFRGNGTIRLPQQGASLGGGLTNYTNTNILCAVIDNGTDMTEPTHSVHIRPQSTTDFAIKVLSADPVQVSIIVYGAQTYT